MITVRINVLQLVYFYRTIQTLLDKKESVQTRAWTSLNCKYGNAAFCFCFTCNLDIERNPDNILLTGYCSSSRHVYGETAKIYYAKNEHTENVFDIKTVKVGKSIFNMYCGLNVVWN